MSKPYPFALFLIEKNILANVGSRTRKLVKDKENQEKNEKLRLYLHRNPSKRKKRQISSIRSERRNPTGKPRTVTGRYLHKMSGIKGKLTYRRRGRYFNGMKPNSVHRASK